MSPLHAFYGWPLLVGVWLVAWIITIPLFHIHIPDTTDRWSLLQSGGAHTVLTPDLPGEYARPCHDSDHRHSSHVSQRVVNSPELGFALFNERLDGKAKAFNVLVASYRFPDTPIRPTASPESPDRYTPLPIFEQFAASRAPPRLVFIS